jgi:hypothetical protein
VCRERDAALLTGCVVLQCGGTCLFTKGGGAGARYVYHDKCEGCLKAAAKAKADQSSRERKQLRALEKECAEAALGRPASDKEINKWCKETNGWPNDHEVCFFCKGKATDRDHDHVSGEVRLAPPLCFPPSNPSYTRCYTRRTPVVHKNGKVRLAPPLLQPPRFEFDATRCRGGLQKRWSLCRGCNTALGHLKDDSVRMRVIAWLILAEEARFKRLHPAYYNPTGTCLLQPLLHRTGPNL